MHYHISPSQLAANMLCPAKLTVEQQYPEGESGAAAIDGTHSHTALAYCIDEGLSDPVLHLGKTMFDHEGAFTMDLDRAKRVLTAINYIKARKAELGKVAIRSEEESDPGAFLGWDDWKGTADVTILSDNILEVIDYKDGRTKVETEENPQILSYGLGRALEYRLPDEFPVRLTIIQPRCGEPVSWDTTVARLKVFAAEVLAWRTDAEGSNPERRPGEKQCKWCRAKGDCGAFSKHALGGVAMNFQNVEVAEQAANKDPDKMTDEELRQFIEGVPLLKQAIAAAEEEALRRFESGHKVPGLKAVRGRGSRSWAFSDEQMEAKLKRMGIPKGALHIVKLISPAQAEKLSWEKRDGTKKTLSQRQLNTLEKEYITRSEGRIQIVPMSSEKPEVELGAEHLFAPTESKPELPAWLTGE